MPRLFGRLKLLCVSIRNGSELGKEQHKFSNVMTNVLVYKLILMGIIFSHTARTQSKHRKMILVTTYYYLVPHEDPQITGINWVFQM